MSSFAQVTAAAFLGSAVGWVSLPAILPEAPFLEVHDFGIVGDQIYVERTYNAEGVEIADWRVTILGEGSDAPFCQTIAGSEEHQGWSRYTGPERARREMSLDVWVGDPGCYERLTPGNYQQFVTWTPRDGSSPVVDYQEFTIP